MTTFQGFVIRRDGYGAIYSALENEMRRTNVPWHFVDMCEHPGGTWTHPHTREWHNDDTTIALCIPDWLPDIHAPKVYAFTMFESTRLPADYVPRLNRCAGVIVPCAWNVETFRANGVNVPIYVCPLGIDPQEYSRIQRNGSHDGKPYTFLWSGTPDSRKGWDVTYKAFWQAFKGNEQARLVMHFRELPRGLNSSADANVEIVAGSFFPERINQMLADADCFVFPSRGEGWGLPPREAAATGLPTIATNYGGLAEGIDYWGLPLNKVGRSKAAYGAWPDDLGEWAEPSVDELADKMVWCFMNHKSAEYFGQNAATWLRNNQTWQETAVRLREIVGE